MAPLYLTELRRALMLVATLGLLGIGIHSQTSCPSPNPTTNFGVPEGITPARSAQLEVLDENTSVARHDGELLHSMLDLRLEGLGQDLLFTRSYRSQVTYTGPFGAGWTHSFDQRIWSDGQGGILHLDGARFALDTYPSSGGALLDCATPGVYRKARSTGAGWEIRDRHGMILSFHAIDGSATSGLLDRIVDSFGSQIVARYDAQGLLTRLERDSYDAVTNPNDRVDFTHVNGRIQTMVDVRNARQWTYTYDASGQLIGVTTPAVATLVNGSSVSAARTTAYGYDKTPVSAEHVGNLLTITCSGQSQPRVQVAYDADDHVQQAFVRSSGTGTPPSFVFTFKGIASSPEILETTVTDRRGFDTVFRFDATGHARTIVDPGGKIATYDLNADGEITRYTYREGNRRFVLFDGASPDRFQHGNVVESYEAPAAGRPGVTTSYRVQNRYDSIYNREIQTTDEGGETVFDYQEDPQTVAALIAAWGIQVPVSITALGDVNGDGRTDQHGGAVIVRTEPPVTKGLPPGSPSSVVRADTWTFDDHGRVLSHADPEGALTSYEYSGTWLTATVADLDPDPAGCPDAPGAYPNSGTARWSKPCTVAHVQARTTFVRDGRGNLIETVDPRGVRSTFQYNALDEIEAYTLASGYDASRLAPDLSALLQAGYGHLVQPGFQEIVERDATGYITRIRIDNRGTGDTANPWTVMTLAHDYANRITRIEEALSGGASAITTFAYDASGNRILETDPEGRVTAQVFDALDRLVETRHGADPTGAVIAGTAVIRRSYDANGTQTAVEGPEDLDGDGLLEKTLFEHDGRGRLFRTVSPVGTETYFEYDTLGHPVRTKVWGAPGGASSSQNNTAGNVILSSAEMERDEAGNVVLTRRHRFTIGQTPGTSGPAMQTTYDRCGREVEQIDPLGRRTTTEYDGLGRVLAITDPLGNRVSYVYDAGGYPLRTIEHSVDPLGGAPTDRTIYDTHDGLGRLMRSVMADEVEYFAYDATGSLSAKADSRSTLVQADPLGIFTEGPIAAPGNLTRYTSVRIATGLRTQVISDLWPQGTATGSYALWAAGFDPSVTPPGVSQCQATTIDHDRSGNVVKVVTPAGKTLLFEYDALSRMTRKTFPNGSSLETTYWRDGAVRQLTLRDEAGAVFRTTETLYDADGRKLSIAVTQAPSQYLGTVQQRFEWNGLDLLTLVSDDKSSNELVSSTVLRTYDSLGNLLTENQNGRTVGHVYDDLDETALVLPSGRQIQRHVDALGRLEALIEGSTGAHIADYAYFGTGSVARVTYGNGTVKSFEPPPPGSGLTNGYSRTGRPLRYEHRAPGGSALSVFSATFDTADSRTMRLRELGGTLTGDLDGYDSRRRIEGFFEVIDAAHNAARAFARDGDGDLTWLAAAVDSGSPSYYAFTGNGDEWG